MTSKVREELRLARSAARLAAVQALYQMEIAGTDWQTVQREFEDHRLGAEIEGAQYRDISLDQRDMLGAREGGVLMWAGHTEAAVDIARLAGLSPAGVVCEVMKDDGTMARLPDLVAFAQMHNLKIGTISDLIAYRRRHDNLVRETAAETITSTIGGEWGIRIFHDQPEGAEHIALIKGDMLGALGVAC